MGRLHGGAETDRKLECGPGPPDACLLPLPPDCRNFFNDAIDHAKHADTERRTGPVRMTASGALSHGTVMIIGLAFLLGRVPAGAPPH